LLYIEDTKKKEIETIKNLSKMCTLLKSKDFVSKINFGNIDYLIKFSEEIAKTQSNAENFMKRLEKTLKDQGVTHKSNYATQWVSFAWSETDFSLRNNLKQLEEAVRQQVTRNEDEFKAQLEEFSKKQSKYNDIKRQQNNPASKKIQELITLEPAFDSEKERV